MTTSETSWLRPVHTSMLSRAEADRASVGDFAEMRTAATTRVLVLVGDTAPLDIERRLIWCSDDIALDDAKWAFLGRTSTGDAALTAVLAEGSEPPFTAAGGWVSLRRIAGALDADDVDAFVTALSVGRWLWDAPFCAGCGAETEVRDGGWSRRCLSCGRQHFPRTDPAVIVAVTSSVDPDRLLLGNNALWEPNRFSCFAGFVEAGESAEAAVHREVFEESGIRVASLTYRGSQPWPYPRSLMLGYVAVAADDADALADGEEILSVRWFTRDEIRAGLAGTSELLLPGGASIAHALIRDWCEGAP
ncbi:NAD(+) diphosphatase [Microbacterium marmarense]|uniref:NAD(+) diphosphatase n=1 Tax=Microbacterium marmarense TaxID=3122051 RepID=A0ABU8LU94_9MICO